MNYTDDQIKSAITLINSFGIGTYVPGCYGVDAESGLLYARDRNAFYAHIKEENKKAYFEKAQSVAKEKGVSLGEYLYFLKYQDCPANMHQEGSYFDTKGWYETCSGKTKNGKPCKRPICLPFRMLFEDFKPGISDRCKWHREKKR